MAKKKKKKPDFLESIPIWKQAIIALGLLFLFGVRIEWQASAPIRSIPSTQVMIPTSIAPITDCTLPVTLDEKFTAHERAVWPKVYRWCPLMMKEGLAQGINPKLLACVMTYESGGDPKAYSQAGASGLFQVMSSTGISAQLYPNMFRDRPTVDQLFVPEINVKVGVGILRSYLLRNSTLSAALRGYNGGNNHTYANNIILMCENLEALG